MSYFAYAFLLYSFVSANSHDFPDCGHSTRIRINTGIDGAQVDEGVKNFPLLVRLRGDSFPFGEADGKGRDIRFVNVSGAQLPCQIERWDSAKGMAEIWVKVDTLSGNSRDQFMDMYWGGLCTTSQDRDSNVFTPSSGFLGVWHLGGMGARVNSVPNASPAVPRNYSGGESSLGIIGFADSLKGGGSSGGYLDIGDGYSSFPSGFTFSTWALPTIENYWAHFLDMGNGSGHEANNIVLHQHNGTQILSFESYVDNRVGVALEGAGAVVKDRWRHYTVTAEGSDFRLYVDGKLMERSVEARPIADVYRTENYLGTSNPKVGGFFVGKMDEPSISAVARSPSWIKLSYESQRTDQQVVTFLPGQACQVKMGAFGDTVVAEGVMFRLTGVANCATAYLWTPVSGPTPRILDPAVKVLDIMAPRVAQDTVLVYRFTSAIDGMEFSREIRVRVLEKVPDVDFTLPNFVDWSGLAPLSLTPVIANLAAIQASPFPELRFRWFIDTLWGDTTWSGTLLIMKVPWPQGSFKVMLCLDNQGAASCRETTVRVGPNVSVRAQGSREIRTLAPGKAFDAKGRLINTRPIRQSPGSGSHSLSP